MMLIKAQNKCNKKVKKITFFMRNNCMMKSSTAYVHVAPTRTIKKRDAHEAHPVWEP